MSDTSENKFRIIDALNKLNGNQITRRVFLDNFIIGDPIKATQVRPRKNTLIKITPLVDSKFYGIKNVWYDRIHVSSLGIIRVTRTTENRIKDFLPQINENYKLFLTESDIVDAALLSTQTGNFQLNLNINPTSLMFYDGDLIITADTIVPDVLISTFCTGFNKYGVYTEVGGTTYNKLIELNSTDCGFDPDTNIFLTIDGGGADTIFSEPWQIAGLPNHA